MKIVILQAFCLRKGLDVSPGDVVEALPFEARRLIALGRAHAYVEPETSDLEATPSAASRGKGRGATK